MSELKQIKIKYFDKDMQKLEKIQKGDLIDLRSAEDVELKKSRKMLQLKFMMKC